MEDALRDLLPPDVKLDENRLVNENGVNVYLCAGAWNGDPNSEGGCAFHAGPNNMKAWRYPCTLSQYKCASQWYKVNQELRLLSVRLYTLSYFNYNL